MASLRPHAIKVGTAYAPSQATGPLASKGAFEQMRQCCAGYVEMLMHATPEKKMLQEDKLNDVPDNRAKREDSYKWWDTILKVVGGGVAVLALLWSIEQYRETNAQNFRFTYWQKKIDAYASLCRSAAGTAVYGGRMPERGDYLQAYYALMIYDDNAPEDKEVLKSADAFTKLIFNEWNGNSDQFPSHNALELSHSLSQACAKSVRNYWDAHFASPDVLNPKSLETPANGK